MIHSRKGSLLHWRRSKFGLLFLPTHSIGRQTKIRFTHEGFSGDPKQVDAAAAALSESAELTERGALWMNRWAFSGRIFC